MSVITSEILLETMLAITSEPVLEDQSEKWWGRLTEMELEKEWAEGEQC